jgi:hypothetical protein
MKNCLYSLLLFFLSSSCQKSYLQTDPEGRLIVKFSEVAWSEYDIKLLGQGGAFRDGVSSFNFYFVSDKELNLDQARRFYLNVFDRLLGMINSDVDLRPHLDHYPFTEKDVELLISFYANGKLEIDPVPPYIALLSNSNNFIFYSFSNEKTESYNDPIPETYEKARSIVKYQDFLRDASQQ